MIDILSDHLLRGLRVLVADDDPHQLDIYGRMVAELGGSCATVADGAEAVEACRTQRFDLVLMDLDMPRLDGFGAIDAIRSAAPIEPTIIAITAITDPEKRARSCRLGAVTCLKKPLAPEQVRRAIAQHVYGLRADAEAANADHGTDGDDEPTFEPERIRSTIDLMGGGRSAIDTMQGLLAAFRRESPDMIAECRAAIVPEPRPDTVVATAHTLASRAAALGLLAAHRYAADLEAVARRRQLSVGGGADLLDRFQRSAEHGMALAAEHLHEETT